jgi:hypothetical protein
MRRHRASGNASNVHWIDVGVRLLAYRGCSRCHPTATANLAELIRLAATHLGNRVLNAGDPQAPTVREIAAHIDAVLGHEVEGVLLDGVA